MDDFLHVFDFDYTLYQTFELINVWSPRGDSIVDGKKCFKLNAIEFHHYNLARDESLDDDSFLDFNNVNFNNAIPIKPLIFIFKTCKNKMILTARSALAEESIRQSIKGDFPIKCLGNGKPESKLSFLKKLNRNDIIVYDDSQKLIDLLNLNSINNVKVSTSKNKVNLNYSFY